MSGVELAGLRLHQTEDHWSHQLVSLRLPLSCLPLLKEQDKGLEKTTHSWLAPKQTGGGP